ncbi:hypothetical protein AYO41_04255 [Verrucomicrobia bacterium SCGC AG-212-E04]|nr:hypothetical protein AYO41_04255 [Verrucomicrobia bacterium SCGC AG-212-E04]
MSDQAVIIQFAYGQTDLSPLYELEDKLIAAIGASGTGEFDGHEVAIGGSDGTFYMYGPDADRMFEAVQPVLASATCIHKAVATIRYGAPGDGVKQRTVAIDA